MGKRTKYLKTMGDQIIGSLDLLCLSTTEEVGCFMAGWVISLVPPKVEAYMSTCLWCVWKLLSNKAHDVVCCVCKFSLKWEINTLWGVNSETQWGLQNGGLWADYHKQCQGCFRREMISCEVVFLPVCLICVYPCSTNQCRRHKHIGTQKQI